MPLPNFSMRISALPRSDQEFVLRKLRAIGYRVSDYDYQRIPYSRTYIVLGRSGSGRAGVCTAISESSWMNDFGQEVRVLYPKVLPTEVLRILRQG